MKDRVASSSDSEYEAFSRLIAESVASLEGSLFTTGAEGLWGAYLEALPVNRQHYTCHACRKFIEAYGGLATVGPDGVARPALWLPWGHPPFFRAAAEALADLVSRAPVTGVFVNPASTWGTPVTGAWSHLSGVPKIPKHSSPLKTAGQLAAEKGQDFITLKRGLSEYGPDAARQAVRVLEADALDRSEKTLGVAKWLMALHERLEGVKGPRRDNLIWAAVATAPPGWCHVRSTMISTLLDDVIGGLPFDTIVSRWAKKMHPLRYQRPTAAPTDGQITAANAVMKKLESSGALARRFARLEEVVAFWRPSPPETAPEGPAVGGPFDHLRPKAPGVKPVELPPRTMTWVRFRDEVLPGAKTLELMAPAHGAYFGLVTAAEPAAPPVLQWDGEPRNPVSWYFNVGGSPASRWGLTGGAWVKVNAVCRKPPHWHHPERFAHHGEQAFLILEGARERREQRGGGLFPECLLSDYHGIRSVMEAYSNGAVIAGHDEGTANGYSLDKGMPHTVRLRVDGSDVYAVDRWH